MRHFAAIPESALLCKHEALLRRAIRLYLSSEEGFAGALGGADATSRAPRAPLWAAEADLVPCFRSAAFILCGVGIE